jgi:hypothetical protein
MCLFDPAIFDTAIFDSCGAVVAVAPSGGFDRQALYFFDNAPKREAAQDVLERAATVDRLAQIAQTQRDAAHIARMGVLRAEFLALAETKKMRDDARGMFATLVADEAERQDAQAAFMALMVSLL